MVKLTSIAAGVAAIAAGASATTTLAQSDEKKSTWLNWVSTSLISELTWPNTTCFKLRTQLRPTQLKLLKPFSTTVTSLPC
ncbi:AHL_G0017870.mRNA.1.CDS.1 [Saccharomyces cerevisiae]|nr:AHL_G0017870.mRNA.1.CDS.1 [Saccharomyces cerevisiae]CAI6652436.1 AHL_G0017870.mRNA.1.CDS.1 [Saccharomyces cerevisiae]